MDKNSKYKVLACVMEANPLHLGHIQLIHKAKKITNSNAVIIILSGSFSQRGEPMVLDKFQRANDIMKYMGADLILNHPIQTATAAGEDFSLGAATLVHDLDIVDTLVCGSELLDVQQFKEAYQLESTSKFTTKLQYYLKQGYSYAMSFRKTFEYLLPGTEKIFQSNALLAYGYYKALRENRSTTELLLLPRTHGISATQIRDMSHLDPRFYPSFFRGSTPMYSHKLLTQRLYRLQRWMMMEGKDLTPFIGYEYGLNQRIRREMVNAATSEEFYQSVVTKRYSRGRISRLLLAGLLNNNFNLPSSLHEAPLQVLKANEVGIKLIREIHQRSHRLLITNGHQLNKLSPHQRKIFNTELKASRLYSLLTDRNETNDFKNPPIDRSSKKLPRSSS